MPTSLRVSLLLMIAVFALSAAYAAEPTPKPQESFAPYWTAEPGWETELQLRNNLVAGALTVTPVLRLANGQEIALDPVTISSRSAASILVSEALLKRTPNLLNQPGTFGSVAFRYTALHARNLSAVSAIHMHAQPIGYHVDAYPVAHSGTAGSMEGIWWQPRPTVKDILVISNSSAKGIGGVLSLSDASGKQWHDRWSLAPHETQRINAADLVSKAGLTGSYGGITFASASSASVLDGAHFLYDEMSGSSALMNLFDRDPAAKLEERTWAGNKQWTMWAPMLALQTPDPAAGFPNGTVLEPMIFLRNATARKQSASITLSWRGDSAKGQVKMPEVILQPFETRQLDIGAMQKQLGIPEDAHWALVTLTSPASPDDLLAVAASYDSTGRYGAQTPFSDNLGAYWSGGQWQVDATHNALIAVTNGGSRATEALLTLHFDDGRKNYEIQQTIQPGDQMWLNLADLIHHSVPDRKGNALPADVTSGTYDLEDLNPGLGGNLIEGKVALDKTWGHLTYGCLTCCGYSPYLSPNPTGLGVGGDGGISALGTNNCTGASGVSLYTYFSQSSALWWSGNTSTATVTSFKGHGVAPGITSGSATATVPSGDGNVPKSCPKFIQKGQNDVTVASLTCTSSVTRGGSASCTAAGASGSTFSNWKFTDASNNTVTSTSTSSTWSGVMVTSGTVSVTVTSSGMPTTPTAQITVHARSWHTNPASASSVPNGTFFTLPVPPQPTGVDSGLGKFNESTTNSAGPNSTIIGGDGPNTGYAYFATQLSISTLFQYEINPDLQSSTSQFSTHQWGACGYISWSNLLTQTNRHEFNSSTQSHYAFYTASINSGANNPGDFFEQQVASPGADLQQFANATSSGLNLRYNQIGVATSVEPFPVNDNETGAFLGNINYAPYATCP